MRLQHSPLSDKGRKLYWILFWSDCALLGLMFVCFTLDLNNPFVSGTLSFSLYSSVCLSFGLFCFNAYRNLRRLVGPVEPEDDSAKESLRHEVTFNCFSTQAGDHRQ